MDQATYNKIVSFIWGIADDVLRDLFKRGPRRLCFHVLRLVLIGPHDLPGGFRRVIDLAQLPAHIFHGDTVGADVHAQQTGAGAVRHIRTARMPHGPVKDGNTPAYTGENPAIITPDIRLVWRM